MAHNLRKNVNGNASFAYSDCEPWHGLGTKFDRAMTSDEALKLASLDFEVEKQQLYLADGTKAPGAYATIASDTKAYLGCVGERYTPLQNREAFAAMDALVGEAGLRYKTAGAIGNGERVWMLAYFPENVVEIVKGDPIEMYFLLSNSHDGTSSCEGRSTSVTVVCQNTLAMAVNGAKPAIKLRHTRSVAERAKIAMSIMADHYKHQQDWVQAMQYLAKHPITDEIVSAFEVEMFGDIDKTPEGRGRTVLAQKLASFEELLVKGKGTEIPGRVGNMYGLLQAYTEWTDWCSQVKGTDDRTNSIVFGAGAKSKNEAMEFALQLAVNGV